MAHSKVAGFQAPRAGRFGALNDTSRVKSHYGSLHLYGHVHDMRTDTIRDAFPDIRALDIGVDSAKRWLGDYTCFSDQEVYDILAQRRGHDLVEWYKEQRRVK